MHTNENENTHKQRFREMNPAKWSQVW